MRTLGRIVANRDGRKIEEIFVEYKTNFLDALSRTPRYTSNINVMMHSLGYFSKRLSSGEKKFFLNSLEEYRREQVPLSVPLNILRSYVVRFEEEYLRQQTFFEPYPGNLLEITDSGKGRDT